MDATKFAILSILVVFFNFIDNTLCSEEEERIKAIYSKCREETQIDENEMETFRKMELPTSTKGKCMMGCLMREASIIVNGRFNKDGALQVAERYYSGRQEELEKARMVVDICEKKIEYETEECEIAGNLASCVIEEAQKIGLTSVPRG
ncbi:general odorant-binding protein 19d-like isoform X2 [Planococcus citri]|uniref:general odorant-binding protein 19d-like isoform X2 n=1 Tax=Planococcus citri TaxID=170843 RepID=UPI0031F8C88A